MSTFTDRLVSTSSKDLRLRVVIDGVPITFEAGTTLDAPTAGRLDGRAMLVSVDESRTVLDRQERRQVGGGATVVVQDRDNGTRYPVLADELPRPGEHPPRVTQVLMRCRFIG